MTDRTSQPRDGRPGLIDLHLHTTASDGRLSPSELVARAAAAGVGTMAVTDHDTTAAVIEVRQHAAAAGVEAVSGIEITAVDEGRDLHVLGYFVDPESAPLQRFLAHQREARVARVRALGDRLAELGLPVDVTPILDAARSNDGRSVGRPQVAAAMVAAGHVGTTREAFDRWLGYGRPGFVQRTGARCAEVIAIVHEAGGLTSLAHPGISIDDARLPGLRDLGLDALEAFHTEHDAAAVARYIEAASRLELAVTGGSDFHGDPLHGGAPGSVSLPLEHWVRFRSRPRRAP